MKRNQFLAHIKEAFDVHPIVALLGPRQCGKTTLAHQFVKNQKAHFFDLENPQHLAQLDNPMLALESIDELIVIDEIQLKPDLFPLLRVLVDNAPQKRFLILGSASRDLIQQNSESLAGRISYIELTPFTLEEVDDMDNLWLRGGFPRSYLAQKEEYSVQWRQSYITTFLERDIPALGFRIPSSTIRRFWMMLTHCHGQTLNLSELGRAFGLSNTAIRNYLSILTGTFMLRELKPWTVHNIKKRQVKSPKIYFRDSGIYHTLSSIDNKESLMNNPKLGASWEGFAIEEIIRLTTNHYDECYFWGTHAGAELDLLIQKSNQRIGFELKYQDAPKLTASMRIAKEELELDKLYVIYPGATQYRLDTDIEVVGLYQYIKDNFGDTSKTI